MIQLPKLHIADEVLLRIGIVAKQTRPKRMHDDKSGPELVEVPDPSQGMPMPGAMPAPDMAPAKTPAGDVPPLDQSGMDKGAALHGADSFDALLANVK